MKLDFGPCAVCCRPCELPGESFIAVTVQPSGESISGDPRIGGTERFVVCEPCSKRAWSLETVITVVRNRTAREVA